MGRFPVGEEREMTVLWPQNAQDFGARLEAVGSWTTGSRLRGVVW